MTKSIIPSNSFQHNRMFVCLCIIIFIVSSASSDRCRSCFAGCSSFETCDCGNSDSDQDDNNSNWCEGEYCYAKLERLADGSVSAIQKGCTNSVSSSFVGDCQYAGDDRSIACFCRGDSCNNNASILSNYIVKNDALPIVQCCQCNEQQNDDHTTAERCSLTNCTRNCTGNYCYLDLVANSQGCDWGHPQLFHFLRTVKYQRFTSELTCAEYYDNYRNYMSGCTCGTDYCNTLPSTADQLTNQPSTKESQPEPQQPAISRIVSDGKKQHFCYSLHAQSDANIRGDIYRQASLCQSPFCFVSWTSVELVLDRNDQHETGLDEGDDDDEDDDDQEQNEDGNIPFKGKLKDHDDDQFIQQQSGSGSGDFDVEETSKSKISHGKIRMIDHDLTMASSSSHHSSLPVMRPFYEISAGCLFVDDEKKVQLGCTAEWSQDERKPLTKHCVCANHLCNHFSLISDEPNARPPYRGGSLSPTTADQADSTSTKAWPEATSWIPKEENHMADSGSNTPTLPKEYISQNETHETTGLHRDISNSAFRPLKICYSNFCLIFLQIAIFSITAFYTRFRC